MSKDDCNIPGIAFSGAITVNGPIFDIHDNEHIHIGKFVEDAVNNERTDNKATEGLRSEEMFHFVHPELDETEAWHIHRAIKRLVANYRIPDICAYLKEQQKNGKLMLPSNPSVMYSELVRLGMPKDEGFSEKNFSNNYMK